MADSYLVGLVSTVNRGEPAPRVLLCVHGLTVIGTVISISTYREWLAGAGGAGAIAAADTYLAAAKEAEADRRRFPEEDLQEAQPRLICLRDATVGSFSHLPFWVGMLDSVSGWSLLPDGS